MLKLGRKYGIDELRLDAIARFEDSLPISLEVFTNSRDHRVVYSLENLADMITLLHDNELYHLVPAVAASIFGTIVNDGDPDLRLFFGDTPLLPGTQTPLQDPWRFRLFRAYFLVDHDIRTHIYQWIPDDIPVQGCPSVPRCAAVIKGICQYFMVMPTIMVWTMSWIDLRNQVVDDDTDGDNLCMVCEAKCGQMYEFGRHRVWNELPGHLSLPSRDPLEASSHSWCAKLFAVDVFLR